MNGGIKLQIKTACLQLEITEEQSKEERIELVLQEMDKARDCELIVLPELWNVNFLDYSAYHRESEKLSGRTISRLAEKAAEIDSFVHAGSIVEETEDGYYNTSVLLDNRGEVLATYRKLHLFGYQSREAELLKPGQQIVTVETPLGRLGLATCYDIRFPEFFRRMQEEGAEILLVCAAWPFPRLSHWQILNRARALENISYLVAVNCAGSFQEHRYAGHSMIIDPWGTVTAGSDYHPGTVRGKIDRDKLQHIRKVFPVLTDRRM